MPRSPVTAPPGYVTVPELAARAGVSYDVAYARVTSGAVRSERTDDGYLVPEEEIAKVVKFTPSDPRTRSRVHVSIWISSQRYAFWRRASAAAGYRSVSVWAAACADIAAARGRRVAARAQSQLKWQAPRREKHVSIQARQARYADWLAASTDAGYQRLTDWVAACADRAAGRLRK